MTGMKVHSIQLEKPEYKWFQRVQIFSIFCRQNKLLHKCSVLCMNHAMHCGSSSENCGCTVNKLFDLTAERAFKNYCGKVSFLNGDHFLVSP